jgi:hypothetical protein
LERRRQGVRKELRVLIRTYLIGLSKDYRSWHYSGAKCKGYRLENGRRFYKFVAIISMLNSFV